MTLLMKLALTSLFVLTALVSAMMLVFTDMPIFLNGLAIGLVACLVTALCLGIQALNEAWGGK